MTAMKVPHFTGANLKLRKHKRNGETIEDGEILCTIEFDAIGMGQAEVDIEAEHDGKVSWFVEDDANVNFGQEIAKIERNRGRGDKSKG